MGGVTPAELLARFDAECRTLDPADGIIVETSPTSGVRRRYPRVPHTSYCMIESPHGLGPDPEAAIAEQVEFFRGRGEEVEWKTYSHDEPADLGARLAAAGFVAEPPEALLLGETSSICRELGPAAALLPEGLTVRWLDALADFDRVVEASTAAFEDDAQWIAEQLLPKFAADPSSVWICLVEESREGPVLCSARADLDDTDVVGLFGGGTRPEWQGRGLYRATVAFRAEFAAAQGKSLLRVDAQPTSEPILRRLGFTRIGTTTPYFLAAGS